jgi:hypothetical protein
LLITKKENLVEERLGVTSPPREKPQENVKRKKNQEKNPCTLPTINIERRKKGNSKPQRQETSRTGLRGR